MGLPSGPFLPGASRGMSLSWSTTSVSSVVASIAMSVRGRRVLGRQVFVVGVGVMAAGTLLHAIEDRALHLDAVLLQALLGQRDLALLVETEANDHQAGSG